MTFPFPAFILAAPFFLAAPFVITIADAPPKFDVEKSCKTSFAADAGGADRQQVSSCVSDEKTAGETITTNWATYPPRDRDHCERLATLGGTASYVEMLTCLQIARDTTRCRPTSRKAVFRSSKLSYSLLSFRDGAPNLGFTRDWYLHCASRVNPTCGAGPGIQTHNDSELDSGFTRFARAPDDGGPFHFRS